MSRRKAPSSQGSKRIQITLACTGCGSRNYKTTRTPVPNSRPLSLKKYCSNCNLHTLHLETK